MIRIYEIPEKAKLWRQLKKKKKKSGCQRAWEEGEMNR